MEVLKDKFRAWVLDIQKIFYEMCFTSILQQINEKGFVTKANIWMVSRFFLVLFSAGALSGLMNCFKILAKEEVYIENYKMYPQEMVLKQGKWATFDCPLWLDITMTSKPKCPIDEEASFNLIKEGKLEPNNTIGEIISKLNST